MTIRKKCPICAGQGEIKRFDPVLLVMRLVECTLCTGTGLVERDEADDD